MTNDTEEFIKGGICSVTGFIIGAVTIGVVSYNEGYNEGYKEG